jgi:hypothetical protein
MMAHCVPADAIEARDRLALRSTTQNFLGVVFDNSGKPIRFSIAKQVQQRSWGQVLAENLRAKQNGRRPWAPAVIIVDGVAISG